MLAPDAQAGTAPAVHRTVAKITFLGFMRISGILSLVIYILHINNDVLLLRHVLVA